MTLPKTIGMNVRRIVTEDAKAEQWRMLGHFAYEPNIERFMRARGYAPDKTLMEFIAGSIRQGEAYFASAASAPLDIAPLLFYYGLTNVMVGAAALTSGARLPIRSHGLRLEALNDEPDGAGISEHNGINGIVDRQSERSTDPSPEALQEVFSELTVGSADGVEVDIIEEPSSPSAQQPSRPEPTRRVLASHRVFPVDPARGGLFKLCDVFSPGTAIPVNLPWTLEELFGSLPDLRDDFLTCYPNAVCYCLPVDRVRRRHVTFERVRTEDCAIYARLFSNIEEHGALLKFAQGFEDAYLAPQRVGGGFVPLHKKLNGRDIGIYSIFGRKFLALPHIITANPSTFAQRDMITLPPLLLMFMALYVLGNVSRYRPEVWNPFVRNDITGERLVVERFLAVVSRYAPNLVLNHIHEARLHFVPPSQGLGNDLLHDEEDSLFAVRHGRAPVGNHRPVLWSEEELNGWVREIVGEYLRKREENA